MVEVDDSGSIETRYPSPVPIDQYAILEGFGKETKFGVILRKKNLPISSTISTGHGDLPSEDHVVNRFTGFLEIPDFGAVILVSGLEYRDGRFEMKEEKLLSGTSDSGWNIRFGRPQWCPGTVYQIRCPKHPEPMEELDGKLIGEYQYVVSRHSNKFTVVGNIFLQKSNLFTFDKTRHTSGITISRDGQSATCHSDKKEIVYASVGFSSGVHYWEFKIEQVGMGSIFIGISELSNSSLPINSRWVGYGMVNRRITLHNDGRNSDHMVYGESFQAGDTIGVMLDMNRGRLSFYVDGLKFGEQHILADMGDAFDDLNGNCKLVKPRTFYPVVGMSKDLDRLAITSRWLSCIGTHVIETLGVANLSIDLLSTWNGRLCNPSSHPEPGWLIGESYKDWKRWRSSRYMKIDTRCRAPHSSVVVDTRPEACVRACLHMGLTKALFTGDRVVLNSTTGRALSIPEEAEILGAFGNYLWYRRWGVKEGDSLAWCFAQHDFEDLCIKSRGKVFSTLSEEQQNATLPRVPSFQGGFVQIIYQSGAVMRKGLEIDNSQMMDNVDHNEIVYAFERRINSSNIARYRVYYRGKIGWISERIRGGSEEAMVRRIDANIDALSSPVEGDSKEQGNERVSLSGIFEEIRASQLDEYIQSMLNSFRVNTVEDGLYRWIGGTSVSTPESSDEMGYTEFKDLCVSMDETVVHWTVEVFL